MKILLPCLLAASAAVVLPCTDLWAGQHTRETRLGRLNTRAAALQRPAPAVPIFNGAVKSPLRVPQDGREYLTVLEEDFSLFAAGTNDNPTTVNLEDSQDAIPSKYTHTPGWHGRGIRQAGGAVCIGKVKNPISGKEMTGQIETPAMDLSRDRGRAYLTLRVRPLVPDMDVLNVRWITAPTNDNPLGATGDVISESISGFIWQDVEIDLTGCPEDASIQIYSDNYELLIDDLKLQQCHPEIEAPKALKWTDYTDDGFTANWAPVEGADHYVLYCFYIRKEGSEETLPDYKYVNPGGSKGYSLKETSYRFDGLRKDKTHYYYVEAVAPSGFVSQESQIVEVLDLTTPTDIQFGTVDKDGFDLTWAPVYNAEGYGVQTILTHTAPADEEYNLIDEHFDAIVNEGSIGEPYGNTIGYYDMDDYGMTRSGWVMYEGGVINGAICLHNYTSEFGTYYEGELVSPTWVISNSTGEITIEADFATLDAGVRPYIQVAQPVTVDGKTQWALAAGGEITSPAIGKDWTHVKLNYKVKPGIIRFSFMTTDGGWLYMDNLRIATNLPAGALQLMPYQYNETQPDGDNRPYIQMTTPDRTRADEYAVAVMAARRRPGSSFFPVYINSEWSDLVDVPHYEWAGIGNVAGETASKVSVRSHTDGITVENPAGLTVTVTDLAGRVAARTRSTRAALTLPRGFYIVSAPGFSAKTIVE